jgi:hypothetical protein
MGMGFVQLGLKGGNWNGKLEQIEVNWNLEK